MSAHELSEIFALIPKTFKQLLFSHIDLFSGCVDCSAHIPHLVRLKRKNNITKKTDSFSRANLFQRKPSDRV